MRLPTLLFLSITGHLSRAAPAPADTLRPLSPARLLRYSYANDLFFRTDYYFTQGMTLTLVHPALARLPTRPLLAAGPRGSTQQFGLTLRYDGFTPLRIQDDFIRLGDRPYAAYLYAALFRVSRRPSQQLTTALELGFIGPAAGGRELQTSIHRVTGNAEPRGWGYQMRNAPIIGYRAELEQQLAAVPGRLELLGTAATSLGTLYTYAGTGLHLRAGRLHPEFDDWKLSESAKQTGCSRWQLYGQATLEARLIGYDATLQGSLFATDDPYTLPASAVRRAVLRSSGGLVLAHKVLRLEATVTWVSPEFAGARPHRWGQLALTRAF